MQHLINLNLRTKFKIKHLRRRAGGGASLWSRSRSNSLPVEIAGGGGSRADLSSVHGSGLGRLTTCTAMHCSGTRLQWCSYWKNNFAHHVLFAITGNLRGGRSSRWSLWSVWWFVSHPGSAHWIQWIVWGATKLGQIHRSVEELHDKSVVKSSAWILCFTLSLPDCFCWAAEWWAVCCRMSLHWAWKAAAQRLSLRLWFLILIFSDCFLQSSRKQVSGSVFDPLCCGNFQWRTTQTEECNINLSVNQLLVDACGVGAPEPFRTLLISLRKYLQIRWWILYTQEHNWNRR